MYELFQISLVYLVYFVVGYDIIVGIALLKPRKKYDERRNYSEHGFLKIYGIETYYKREHKKLIDPEYDRKWERFVALHEVVKKHFGKTVYLNINGLDVWIVPQDDNLHIEYPPDDISPEDFEILVQMRAL